MNNIIQSVHKVLDHIKNVPTAHKKIAILETEQQRLMGLIGEQHKHILDLRKELKTQRTWIAPGHFYSPITNDAKFKKFTHRKYIPGIDLNTNDQLKLLKKFSAYYNVQPFTKNKSKENRYYFNNDQFSYSDAFSLFCMLMHYKPKRVVEVGSGYSSAIMLDTNNKFLQDNMKLTFIEPYPKRLKSVLTKYDKPKILEKFVQDVPLTTFKNLEAGDILFIDSSHVAKSGSDVNWLYHEVLPIVKPGVIIHVHDIMYPFEYIDEWIQQGRSWNEIYMLRCLLTDSPHYKIIFWANYLHKFYKKDMIKTMPLSIKNAGGSIWFIKR